MAKWKLNCGVSGESIVSLLCISVMFIRKYLWIRLRMILAVKSREKEYMHQTKACTPCIGKWLGSSYIFRIFQHKQLAFRSWLYDSLVWAIFISACKAINFIFSPLKWNFFAKDVKWRENIALALSFRLFSWHCWKIQKLVFFRREDVLKQFVNFCSWMSVCLVQYHQRVKRLKDDLKPSTKELKRDVSRPSRGFHSENHFEAIVDPAFKKI